MPGAPGWSIWAPMSSAPFDVVGALGGVDAAFAMAANPDRAEQEKRYLKSALRFYGASLPVVRKVAKGVGKLTHDDLRAFAETLWQSDWHEHRALAVVLLERQARVLGVADLAWLIELVRTSFTWAYVDSLAVHTIGSVLARHPEAISTVKAWACDPDFWLRRTALLATLLELRRGRGDPELIGELAVPMLDEREFFIRKAIGWVLREIARTRPDWVRSFVDGHPMSALTRREAMRGVERATRA